LNIYKEGTYFLNEDELQTAESKVGGGENTQPASCCRVSDTETSEEKKAGYVIANDSGVELSKLILDTDFNEWVGGYPSFLLIRS
jgi:hypothetical protein